jgi:hypothetical protein
MYEVGTHIDFSYLNPQPAVKQSMASQLYDVGTEFVFQFANNHLTTAKRIPVMAL